MKICSNMGREVEGVTSHPDRAIAAVAQCILTANSALLIEFEIIELEMAPEVEIVED
jgi:hypothetical protein